jgi:hypothetical protein
MSKTIFLPLLSPIIIGIPWFGFSYAFSEKMLNNKEIKNIFYECTSKSFFVGLAIGFMMDMSGDTKK